MMMVWWVEEQEGEEQKEADLDAGSFRVRDSGIGYE